MTFFGGKSCSQWCKWTAVLQGEGSCCLPEFWVFLSFQHVNTQQADHVISGDRGYFLKIPGRSRLQTKLKNNKSHDPWSHKLGRCLNPFELNKREFTGQALSWQRREKASLSQSDIKWFSLFTTASPAFLCYRIFPFLHQLFSYSGF